MTTIPSRPGVDNRSSATPAGGGSAPSPGAAAELRRLDEDALRLKNWKRWGPYLAERQWGTVREDYSPQGDVWNSFSHDQARSRAYRWGEDGLLGICDRQCRLCLALALWNGKDPILKERLFGLTGPEGNHGEDVKEHYFYLDSTPTHSYMKAMYKYPQAEFPYQKLVEENRRRSRGEPEFELADTGAFDQGRYFDVTAEYAKAGDDDVLVRVHVANRGPDEATLHVLPTLWFRNTWSWGSEDEAGTERPSLRAIDASTIIADHETLGRYRVSVAPGPDRREPELLFTENESNIERLWQATNPTPFVKDAFHRRVIGGERFAVNPQREGTKAAAWYTLRVPAGQTRTIKLRLCKDEHAAPDPLGEGFEKTFAARLAEAEAFYAHKGLERLDASERVVARQAYAGLLWSKQFYHYVTTTWLGGDPKQPAPPAERKEGRNADWHHVFSRDVLSMPDKWEYPWFAAWDLAFQMIPFAQVDPRFAKDQLLLMLREWYMHPSGQLPAYEFAFGDVNPPVHAWACWRVYKMTGVRGRRDTEFLARAFQKLLLNFTWWVNRKDPSGKNLFAGGFLGLDNIGVFDRSRPLPTGGHLEQADGTAWMAFYCGTMLSMALELAKSDPSYEDLASKFFEHFVAITDSINHLGGSGLWDEQDGFYYDQLRLGSSAIPLKVRSLVGVLPLLAVEVLEDRDIDRLPGFKKRLQWFLKHRKDLPWHATCACAHGEGEKRHRLLALPTQQRLQRMLKYLFDENEFLSEFGIRSLSRVHADKPYAVNVGGEVFSVEYTPGESTTGLFGGNSNWRGPIWMPLNFLIIEALERYHHFYGDRLQVEFPTGSGNMVTLQHAAADIRRRLSALFLPGAAGQRPSHAGDALLSACPHSQDLVLFHEHFHGDSGRGLGATHQTGWTALIATMLLADHRADAPHPHRA